MKSNQSYQAVITASKRIICFVMVAIYLLSPAHDAISFIGHEASHQVTALLSAIDSDNHSHHSHDHHNKTTTDTNGEDHSHRVLGFFDQLMDLDNEAQSEHLALTFGLDKHFSSLATGTISREATRVDHYSTYSDELLLPHLRENLLPPASSLA